MTDKFELLCMGISQVHKKIQKIKKMHMNSFGLKGTHVMCIYFLSRAENGLTAAELCEKCGEDKAGISRTLAELEEQKLISYDIEEIISEFPIAWESEISDNPVSADETSQNGNVRSTGSADEASQNGNVWSTVSADEASQNGNVWSTVSADAASRNGKPENGKSAGRKRYRAPAFLTAAGRAKADMINKWVNDAVNLGSLGISVEEEEIFYRVLFRISDNLTEAISYTISEYDQT